MDTAFIFITIQWVAIGILFFLFVYAKLQKSTEMQKYATMLIIASILMLLGYTMEMESTNIESAYFGTVLSYVGEPFVLVSSLMLICTFYGKRIPKWAFVFMMGYALLIPILVFTNKYHHGYYSVVEFDANAKYSPLICKHGPLYYFNIASNVFYSIALVTVILTGYMKSKSALKKRLSAYSMLMVLSVLIGYVGYFLDGVAGYDTTMLGLSVGVLFMSILFFRCRIFDVVDTAKDYALDISQEGLLILDDANEIVYTNRTAERVLKHDIQMSYLQAMEDGESVCRSNGLIYSITVSTIKNKGDYLGKSIEIHDVTESVNHKERLEMAIKATREKLESIQRTIFGSFASLVEARSVETGGHIRRVSRYTEIIAKSLRKKGQYSDVLTDDYINMLSHSAPLHDVGKISISDTILLKPGKLTDTEFEEMKKHSALGAAIVQTTMSGLESEDYVDMAAEIAMYHHERWDGTGYPNGTKGEAIPLSARIVALADCYDAMTSKRCYKEAFAKQKAMEIIREESGTHFDPDIVEAFLDAGLH